MGAVGPVRLDPGQAIVVAQGTVIEEAPRHGAARAFHVVGHFQRLGTVGGVGHLHTAFSRPGLHGSNGALTGGVGVERLM